MSENFTIPPLISPAVATALLTAMAQGEDRVMVTLNLGQSERSVDIVKNVVKIDSYEISAKKLEKIVKRGNVVFAVDEDGLYPLEIRDQGYVKMVPAEDGYGPPTFEISGIKMHRTKDISPYDDARTKAEAVVRTNDTVLDTCGGFGYTALWARRVGASDVISVERNPDIVALRKYNPWSQDYLLDENIEKIAGNAAEEITQFDRGYFDSILHDPPRFSLAEELYGGEFLQNLITVLRSGGYLAFYTGEPYRASKGNNFVENLVKRLQKLGMVGGYNKSIQCIVVQKRR